VAAKPPSGGGGSGTTVSYSIIRLAEADGMVMAINNSGKAVGRIETPAGNQPMLWEPETTGGYSGLPLSTTIGTGSTSETLEGVPQDISDNGLIAGALGSSLTGLGGWLPVVWLSSSEQPLVLPYGPLVVAGSYVEGGAFAVSKTPLAHADLRAVVVGRYIEYPQGVVEGAPAIVHVVAWAITAANELRAPVELDVVMSAAGKEFDSVAIDVNSKLEVVGTVVSESDIYKHAYRWQLSWDGAQKKLTAASATALFPNLQWSSALAINEQGDICGERAGSVSEARQYLLEYGGSGYVDRTLVSPSTSRNEYYSMHSARALNGLGTPQVIGYASLVDSRSYVVKDFVAILWQASSAWDLEKVTPQKGIEPSYMTCVNDLGVIGGQGWEYGVQRKAPIVMIRN
jgi:hypothetical protein